MLRYDQARVGDPEVGVDLVTPDFLALAAAFGLPATGVPAIRDGLAVALAKAVASGGPHLVHVPARLDPAAHDLAALARELTPRLGRDHRFGARPGQIRPPSHRTGDQGSPSDADHIAIGSIAIYRDGTRADPDYRSPGAPDTKETAS